MSKKTKDEQSEPKSPLLDEQGQPIESAQPESNPAEAPKEDAPVIDNPEGARNTPTVEGVVYELRSRTEGVAKDADGKELTFASAREGADALRQKQIERPGDAWELVPKQ